MSDKSRLKVDERRVHMVAELAICERRRVHVEQRRDIRRVEAVSRKNQRQPMATKISKFQMKKKSS